MHDGGRVAPPFTFTASRRLLRCRSTQRTDGLRYAAFKTVVLSVQFKVAAFKVVPHHYPLLILPDPRRNPFVPIYRLKLGACRTVDVALRVLFCLCLPFVVVLFTLADTYFNLAFTFIVEEH